MALSFPNAHIIALDLPDSVNLLKEKRKKVPNMGKNLLEQKNIQILEGNGLLSIKDQINSKKDAFKNTDFQKMTPADFVVIRASNSIDIYSDWEKEVKPALGKMALEFKDNTLLLFFADKILVKPSGQTQWKKVGFVSQRGFNHNVQTTSHVDAKVPPYALENGVQIKNILQ
ncbi:MAG: hypothetical protein WCJ84_02990 [Candidatus Peregrinibacteria bacterium]